MPLRQAAHVFLLPHKQSSGNFLLVGGNESTSLELTQQDVIIWKLFKRWRSLNDVVRHVTRYDTDINPLSIAPLIRILQDKGFLVEQNIRQKQPALPVIYYLLDNLLTMELNWYWLATQMNKLRQSFLAEILPAIVIALSSTLILANVLTLDLNINPQPLTAVSPVLTLLIALVCLSLHEIGHALVMIYFRAPIVRAGFSFYLGLPVLFIDTSAIWGFNQTARILTAIGGIGVNILLMLICQFLYKLTGFSIWQIILLVNLTQIIFSALPFIKMDGYYVMCDLLKTPNLDRVAQHAAMLTKGRILKHHLPNSKLLFLAGFNLLSSITTIMVLVYSLEFWRGLFLFFR